MQNLSISFFSLFLLLTSPLAAQSPYLDNSFGVDGRFSIYFNLDDLGALSRIYTTAIQSDGKIVGGGLVSSWAAGFLEYKVALTRIMPNGILDYSFGVEGRVVLDNKYIRCCTQLAIQPDGKILVSGWGWGSFMVVRFLSNGTLDSSFGTNGIATVNVWTLPDEWDISNMVLLSNGKILLAGTRETGLEKGMIALLKADGKQDLTFGNFGAVKFNAAVWADVQSDGKILVATSATGQGSFKVERFDANGDIDNTFSPVESALFNQVTRLFALSDGKFVVLGSEFPIFNPIAVRFNADGSLDSSFGDNGAGTINYANQIPPYTGLIQPDGKLLVFGGEQGWGFVTRFNQDGTLDTDFGADGFIVPETTYEVFFHGNLLPDGKIVVPSRYENAQFLQMGSILRYMGSSSVGVIDAHTPLNTPLIYPNPIEGTEVSLEYEILQASNIRIDLLDVQGLIRSNLLESSRPSGKNKECLHLPSTLCAGAYLLNIQTEQGNSVVKILVRQ